MLSRGAGMQGAPLSPELFRRFCRIAHAQAGIQIKEGKEALVGARVSKRARKLRLPSIRSYLRYLEQESDGRRDPHFVDVITTNFTRFFREPEHFEDLKRFVAARPKPDRPNSGSGARPRPRVKSPTPWPCASPHSRRASASSFAFWRPISLPGS